MAATPMSFTEQHMQPFASGTKGAGWADVEFASETVSCFSMSIAVSSVRVTLYVRSKVSIQSPNSFRMTAIFFPCCSVKI